MSKVVGSVHILCSDLFLYYKILLISKTFETKIVERNIQKSKS